MLDEQFNTNPEYYEFVNKNFVAMHFLRTYSGGTEMFELYEVKSTPTVVVAEADGKEIDRIVGYSPPPENFLLSLKNAFNGIDTFAKLKAAYESNPDNLEVTFKLAYKYENSFRDREKAGALYKKIIDSSEEAKSIMIPYEASGEDISLLEFTEYRYVFTQSTRELFREFVKKYPDSRFSDVAYTSAATSFRLSEESEEAEEFFETASKKYPTNLIIMSYYSGYCISTKSNLDKGITAVEKYNNLTRNSDSYMMGQYARMLEMKGDSAKVEEVYGESYIERKISMFANDLISYSNFWQGRNKNIESAEKMVELALQVNPDNFNIRYTAAIMYASKDKLDKAEKIFGPQQMEDLNAEPYLSIFVSFWMGPGKNLDYALEAAKIYKEKSTSYLAAATLARVYIAMEKEEEAIKEYGPEYVKDYLDDSLVLISYASFWTARGTNLESALEAMRRYEKLTNIRAPITTMAQLYAKMDNMEEALKYYGPDYCKDYMTNASALNSYAWFWALEGKNLEHALEISKKSIELRSNQFNWDTLSMVYWKMGKYKEAIEAEEKALEFAPGTETYLKRIEDIKKDIKKKGEK